MVTKIVKFRDWVFEADVELTQQTYANVQVSGAEECTCGNCKNYLAFRDKAFPNEIKTLFNELGINYTKESEIITDQKHQSGLYDTSGWFHFKGRILNGKNAYIPISATGFTIELTQVADNFLIGFGPGNSLAFFEDNDGLIEVMFQINIPWVIDPELE